MKILSDSDYKDLVGVLKSANSTIETLRRMNVALIDMLEKERNAKSRGFTLCSVCKHSELYKKQVEEIRCSFGFECSSLGCDCFVKGEMK